MVKDGSQEQIDTMKRQIDGELAASRVKHRRSTALMMTLGLAALLLFAFVAHRQRVGLTNRINSLEVALEKTSHPLVAPTGGNQTAGADTQAPDDSRRAIEARLQALETLQEAMVSTSALLPSEWVN